MDPTDRQDGSDRAAAEPSGVPQTGGTARARDERRAEALRANLKRRKAQSRGRADAERADPSG